MSIRLSKAIRELNIGLQTAVDFLEKKKSLGEVKSDLNFKLSDEQYAVLEKEFKSDQAVKNDAVKLIQKKAKEKKIKEVEDAKAESLLEQRQQFKPVGKIDLEALNRPAKTKTEEQEKNVEVSAEETEPGVVSATT